jgi:adenylosuccinate synthase
MKRSAHLNSLTGLCITKLDVLDGLEKIGICTGYQYQGGEIDNIPIGAECYAQCLPVIEEVAGWKESTAGVTVYEDLPLNAKNYIRRIEELVGVPVHVLSTGPDRNETITLRHPFD